MSFTIQFTIDRIIALPRRVPRHLRVAVRVRGTRVGRATRQYRRLKGPGRCCHLVITAAIAWLIANEAMNGAAAAMVVDDEVGRSEEIGSREVTPFISIE